MDNQEKRPVGRPRLGDIRRNVSITCEESLFVKAKEFAYNHKMSFSEMIGLALSEYMYNHQD